MTDIITELRSEPFHAVEGQDVVLAKDAADTLNRHYPGHLWAVNVNSEGGVMIIKNMSISALYGMVLHLKNVYQDPTLRMVIRAAGELLERAHMARKGWNGEFAKVVEGVAQKHQPRNGIIF